MRPLPRRVMRRAGSVKKAGAAADELARTTTGFPIPPARVGIAPFPPRDERVIQAAYKRGSRKSKCPVAASCCW